MQKKILYVAIAILALFVSSEGNAITDEAAKRALEKSGVMNPTQNEIKIVMKATTAQETRNLVDEVKRARKGPSFLPSPPQGEQAQPQGEQAQPQGEQAQPQAQPQGEPQAPMHVTEDFPVKGTVIESEKGHNLVIRVTNSIQAGVISGKTVAIHPDKLHTPDGISREPTYFPVNTKVYLGSGKYLAGKVAGANFLYVNGRVIKE